MLHFSNLCDLEDNSLGIKGYITYDDRGDLIGWVGHLLHPTLKPVPGWYLERSRGAYWGAGGPFETAEAAKLAAEVLWG